MTSHRLPEGGRLIDRSKPVKFRFNGRWVQGHEGDTIASALLGAGQMLMGRSFKYHRPRGPVAAGAEEPNALMGLGRGDRFEPNQRATTTPVRDGLRADSQNHWPSLERDVGQVNSLLSQFLPAGFYYKTFIAPRPFWKHVYEPIIRRSAGLGRAPDAEARDPDRYEQTYAFCDLLVVGGGIAGLRAAHLAGASGARVIVLEQAAHWGGRAPADGVVIDNAPAEDWISKTLQAVEAMPNVTLLPRTQGAGVHDHGYVLACEESARDDGTAPRHRLWRIRARRILTATGALERPLAFAGNDIPGVMLSSAMRDYAVNWGVAAGRRVVVVTNNDDAYRSVLVLHRAGVGIAAVVDARDQIEGELSLQVRALGVEIHAGCGIERVHGGSRVKGVSLCRQAGTGGVVTGRIDCDAVAMSGGWSPAVHLWSHCGGKLIWDKAAAAFRPDPDRGPTGADGAVVLRAAGAANGHGSAQAALQDADATVKILLEELGHTAPPLPEPEVVQVAEAPLLPVWMMPAQAGPKLRAKMFLDFQNDVKVSDIRLAAQEGFRSVEHAKRYTTLGMATDQGKLSNINGLAVLSEALSEAIPEVGTTTFRPPYTPFPLGAVAGEATGTLFQPLRRTPMDAWHEGQGATWEPVGQWRRPFAYPRDGETVEEAVAREVKNARQRLGLLDASTLGKLLVRGPDAGRFLDMLYTNMMSTLKPGRCRYGLMCNENGFLMDDGVVARIDDGAFVCHTTSGGTEHVHGWMEDWLQTEFWDWRVHVANLTEQYAQIAVVGPNARKMLQTLGDMDLSDEALPFMGWADGEIAGHGVRVYRISFSGELSFEIAVRAGEGRALWDRLVEAGARFGAMPYGTEALHVLRAEKGFIMIGDETDGTVTPLDLGLGWAVSKKKDDFLGRRGMERPALRDPERWRLVGLETLCGGVLPDGAYAVTDGINDNLQRVTEGRVTSTYHSPNLGRGIAMGLVRRGPERMGEVLRFPVGWGRVMKARIVAPVFLDDDRGAP